LIHINELHNSINQEQFDARWNKISQIWLKYQPLVAFHNYFKKQWLEITFNKWAIFHTPPGYLTTNNPIESYNNQTEHFFTNRLKLNLIPAFKIFKDLINYESNINFKNEKSVFINKHQETQAKKLEPGKFKRIDKYIYEYKHKNGKVSCTNLSNKSCSCLYYIDKCIWYHLIFGANIHEKAALPGMQIFDKFSLRHRKKDKKITKIEFDDEDSDFDVDIDEVGGFENEIETDVINNDLNI
jgi:hypothetical protein